MSNQRLFAITLFGGKKQLFSRHSRLRHLSGIIDFCDKIYFTIRFSPKWPLIPMSNREHIDRILSQWEYDPEQVSVRIVSGDDGRDLIQMRIDMGLLQLEATGRPDGKRPEGHETYFDYLNSLILNNGEDFVLSDEQCAAADREFVQFYHRRICWLALRNYRKAVEDADHTLQFMDFCRDHAPEEDWALTHEQYRPFVLFHRTQAAALVDLEESGPEAAIQVINKELKRFRDLYPQYDAEEQFEENELVSRLSDLRESLRVQFDIGRTLDEQLADAVAAEKYELAAQLRDKLAQQQDRQN